MADYRLGEIEQRFAELIWTHEPLSSGELVRLSQETLDWKKSTTYTILRRLCQRGLFQNRDGVVTSLVSRAEFDAARSTQFVDETFSGSLPAFLAAFTRRKRLSDAEIAELQTLINAQREADHA